MAYRHNHAAELRGLVGIARAGAARMLTQVAGWAAKGALDARFGCTYPL